MRTKNLLAASILAVALCASVVAQEAPPPPPSSNPLINFLNPTNTFLEAQELNFTLDAGYQRQRLFSTGIGARFWVSDSQGASISYQAFPHGDKGEWQIAYGYRTAWKSLELDMLAGMAEDVDHSLIFRPYLEVDAIYQVSKTLGAGLKTQVTNGERPYIGMILSYKFGK